MHLGNKKFSACHGQITIIISFIHTGKLLMSSLVTTKLMILHTLAKHFIYSSSKCQVYITIRSSPTTIIIHSSDAAKNLLDGCIKPINWDTDYYKETCEVKFDFDLLKRYAHS